MPSNVFTGKTVRADCYQKLASGTVQASANRCNYPYTAIQNQANYWATLKYRWRAHAWPALHVCSIFTLRLGTRNTLTWSMHTDTPFILTLHSVQTLRYTVTHSIHHKSLCTLQHTHKNHSLPGKQRPYSHGREETLAGETDTDKHQHNKHTTKSSRTTHSEELMRKVGRRLRWKVNGRLEHHYTKTTTPTPPE